jgi:hypothetical protein
MAGAPNIAELDRRALAHRETVLAALIYRDARSHRVTNEVRALNWDAPRLVNLHVTLDGDTGRWSASTDTASTNGRGVCQLVATLACVDTASAAAFLARILPAESAAR